MAILTTSQKLGETHCHCGRLGMFGYRDRAAWPRRLASGVANEINPAEVKLVWFCAEHRLGQHYADAIAETSRAFDRGAP
jgi:hypothetical protein